ncbi:MAG: Uma2 family endonuclease [Anaerolineae bacterium]|nr:Uma2 family endonuclease [Thermoflexales bacterium]MDW8408439.1 Uma2 family endonuclease [Anaerolineae bacterium]
MGKSSGGALLKMMRVAFHQYAQHDQSQFWEWIEGALDLLPPLSFAQRCVQERLLQHLSEFVELNEIGIVIPGPFAVRMPEEMQRGREPDLLFVPNIFVEAIQENYVNSHGVAIVVEIADARSRYRDRVDKFKDYQLAGIPEYWIIDVDEHSASFYSLHKDNRYHKAELAEDGLYHSTVLKGYTLDPRLLWQECSDRPA